MTNERTDSADNGRRVTAIRGENVVKLDGRREGVVEWILQRKRTNESIRAVCHRLAPKGVTGEYLRQIVFYGKEPSVDKWRRIEKMANTYEPPAPVVPVRCSSVENKDFIIATLSNQEREDALREAAERKEYGCN